jgi:hypothetical protein
MTDSDADKVSRTDCTPWRDGETLRHFYQGKRYSLLETADAVGCTEGTVSQWCDKLDIETRDAQEARDSGTPEDFKDRGTLYELYWGERLTCAEIADEYDVTPLTVSKWLRRHDIETRPAHDPGKDRASLTCDNCGSEFSVIPSRAESAKYCSRECYYDSLDMPTGDDHWSWKETPDYRPAGSEWQELRQQVRERDGFECRVCGVPESDLPRELDAHHLKRVRDHDDPRAATEIDPSYVVAVCRSCHRMVERYAPLLPDGVV